MGPSMAALHIACIILLIGCTVSLHAVEHCEGRWLTVQFCFLRFHAACARHEWTQLCNCLQRTQTKLINLDICVQAAAICSSTASTS